MKPLARSLLYAFVHAIPAITVLCIAIRMSVDPESADNGVFKQSVRQRLHLQRWTSVS